MVVSLVGVITLWGQGAGPAHMLMEQLIANLGSGKNFPPGRIGTGPQGFFPFLCNIEQSLLPGLLWAIFGHLLLSALTA